MVIAQNSYSTNADIIMPEKLVQPPYLKAGDTIAIVAPSGLLKNRNEEIEKAIDLAESWDLNVVVGEHVYEHAGHFAGTDAQRAQDLQKAFDDPKIKAIWSARGGYGAVRILDLLDYSKFKAHPKWLIGYSDITALHNDIHNQGIETIHAMMCTSLEDDLEDIKASISTLKNAIFGSTLSYNLKGSKFNKPGVSSGQLIGGNLTLLHTMLGSRSSINTDGKIIFIEEIGEYAYHIDRMLISMKRAGYFENCKGIIVGDISKVRKNTTPWGKPVKQLILDVFSEYSFPILFNFPAGHEDDNRALILGRNITINVGKEESSVNYFD
jgi:muramoyltetrapeptide carboxypeptidase